jgi:aspartate aminotransferase
MTLRLSERVFRLQPSASIAAKARVAQLQAQGRDIIDFTIGEPDFATPAHIVEAAVAALRGGDTHYVATPGTHALRTAICRKFERENGLFFRPENIVVGCGAKQIIFEALAATLQDDDEVIIPAPYWVSYPEMVSVNGGTPVIVTCGEKDRFKLSPEALESAITGRTRWLVLNSPNNPSGAVYSRDEIESLCAVLRRHPHVWVLTDDIYEHITFEGAEALNPVQIDPAFADRALVVNGVSKAYAMTGWRIGYAAGPPELIGAITKLIGQTTTCASSISQAAAVAALDGDQAHVARAAELFAERRSTMLRLIGSVPGFSCIAPEGAFYLFPSVAGLIGSRTKAGKVLRSDIDVASYLLETANVAVLDGSAYGLSPHLRLSFATATDAIAEGCRRIREACEQLDPSGDAPSQAAELDRVQDIDVAASR